MKDETKIGDADSALRIPHLTGLFGQSAHFADFTPVSSFVFYQVIQHPLRRDIVVGHLAWVPKIFEAHGAKSRQ